MGLTGGVIHAGAWEGLEYIDDKRRLLLFEPQAEAFHTLQANVGDHANVELVHAALGAVSGVAEMFTATPSHSSSLLEPNDPRTVVFEGKETVVVMTLDQAMRGRKPYEVLRIDTQGYELEVLKGAKRTLKKLKRIECELHDPSAYPGAGTLVQIDGFLQRRGFERTHLDRDASDDWGDVVYECHR